MRHTVKAESVLSWYASGIYDESSPAFMISPQARVLQTNLYRPHIDGLRAAAVLSVLGFHTRTPGFGGGFVGVDVFFAISGYLICSILIRELEDGSFSVARFYTRRCKRILPALFAVLGFCLCAGLLVLSPYEAQQLGRGVLATALSVSNFNFWKMGNYFDQGGILNPLLMTWSLAVEEQFYLLFPLLMAALYKRHRKYLVAAVGAGCLVSLLLSVGMEYRHPSFNFYLPFTRAWEIGSGALLALLEARRERWVSRSRVFVGVLSSAGLLTILACIVFYTSATPFPGYQALPVIVGTLLVIHFEARFVSRLLLLRPLVLTGLISYSLYLWHWPLLSFAAIVGPESTSPAVRAVLMLIALGAAVLSYHFVETPFRRTATLPRAVLLRYGWGILSVVCVGGAFVVTDGFAVRSPHLAAEERALDLDRAHACISFTDRGPNLAAQCFPPAGGSESVALLGDSHAEAIESTVRQIANGSGRRLVVLTGFSCPPLRGVTRLLPQAPLHATDCARFNDAVFGIVSQREDVKVVVLIGSWAMLPEDHFILVGDDSQAVSPSAAQSEMNLIHGVEAEVEAFRAAGKKVVLIDDWPSLDVVPLVGIRYAGLPVRRRLARLLAGHGLDDFNEASRPRARVVPEAGEEVRNALRRMAQAEGNVRFVDTKQALCGKQMCAFRDGDKLLYTDAAHISQFGAEQILGGVRLP